MGFQVFDYGAMAGIRAEADSIENEFSWGRRELDIVFSALISGAAVDAGSTPTTVLRSGLLLGRLDAAPNKWKQYDPTATDGTQVARGILGGPSLRTVDINGNQQDLHAPVIVGGPVMAGKIFGLDTLARASMFGAFIFDDLAGNNFEYARTVAKTANYQVTAADNGTLFTTTGAAGEVDFTLPAAPVKGMSFTFYNTVGQTMKVIAAAGKLVAFNNAAATSVAFSTAGNLIGGCVQVFADETAAKWIVQNHSAGANTITVA